jgi:hypothetical protein
MQDMEEARRDFSLSPAGIYKDPAWFLRKMRRWNFSIVARVYTKTKCRGPLFQKKGVMN